MPGTPFGVGNPTAVGSHGDLTFSLGETRQLWSFLDGSIMDAYVRRALRRSWGPCPRHSWAYAIAEVELRGGRPFSTSILYEDLTSRAARTLTRAGPLPWPLLLRKLRPRGPCFTCDYVGAAGGQSVGVISDDRARLERLNRLARTPQLLAMTRAVWEQRSCPQCLGGQGPVCRLHLLAGSEPDDRDRLAAALADLANRLHAYIRSLTWEGPAASAEAEVSWVEALGWFAGWELAPRLTDTASI